jgi:3,4-dihydroxy-2-butanone 4-phosphate synthase
MEPAVELDSIESALSAVARGAFAVVVDDADRENEGDLIGLTNTTNFNPHSRW